MSLCACVLFYFSRRFGREGILALACTCRIFHLGMHSEVQAAKLSTALVEWPLCGAVVELTRNFSVGRGLFNGARCVVSKVGRDALEVHLLGPARKLQGLTSPRVTVPRACVRPDVNLDSGDHGPHAYQPTCHKLPQGRFGCRTYTRTLTYLLIF